MRPIVLRTSLVVAAILAGACGAAPTGLPDGVELPTNAHGEHAALAAVGLIEPRCSATLVDAGGGDGAPAYALTAGHCTSDQAEAFAQVIDHEPADLGTIAFDDFADTGDAKVEVPIAELAYESVDGADLALYRLDATMGALRARGLAPIALADAPPPVGAPIEIASFPHETDDDPIRALHVSRCDEEASVRLAEGTTIRIGFPSNECASIRPGSSGGALLDEHGALFAVLSTQAYAVTPASPTCWIDEPCEIDTAPATSFDGRVYGALYRLDATMGALRA